MRLIDADALKDFYGKWSNKHTEFLKPEVDRYIDVQPTIDAVPVCRCKDCVQWHRHCGVTDSPNGHCFTHDIEMNQHDFCSYGERKDGEG